MAKKGKGLQKSKKEQYAKYQATGSYTKNKKAKVARHMKKHPNDVQTKNSPISTSATRKAPVDKKWTGHELFIAGLYKLCGLNGNSALVDDADIPHISMMFNK